jgi:Ni/Co efflux regulator RcnB
MAAAVAEERNDHTTYNNHTNPNAPGYSLGRCPGLHRAAVRQRPGNGGKKQKHEEASSTVEVRVGSYFEPRQRDAVTEYYGKQRAAGRCPPGLAKKNNGCMPPGQAKKWAVGQRLPSTVVLYPIPREVQIRIGVPPAGYRYVRTANDILLIAIGTMIVVDAIEDLMKL